MNAVLFTRFAHHAGRGLILLLLVWCGGCDNSPPPTETTETLPNGGQPNTMPAADAIPQLIILINNYRTSQGLNALVHDPTGDLVANDEVTTWVNDGSPSPFSYDVLGDLHNQGESASQALDVVAQGYQSYQDLYNALLSINALSGPFNNIGVALINQGHGNDWAIVMY